MNYGQRRSLLGIRDRSRRLGRDELVAYARFIEAQPERTRDTLAQIAETQRMLASPRRRAIPAGWDEFIASTEPVFAPDWEELIESFDAIYWPP